MGDYINEAQAEDGMAVFGYGLVGSEIQVYINGVMVKDTYFIFMTPRNKARSYGEFTVLITEDELDVDEVKTVCATATQYPLAESDFSDEFEFTLDTAAPEMIKATGTWKEVADLEGTGTFTVTFSEELDEYDDEDAVGWFATDMTPGGGVVLSFINAELTEEETDVVEVDFTTVAEDVISPANIFAVFYDDTGEIKDLAGNPAEESFVYCYLEIEEVEEEPTNGAPIIASILDDTRIAGEVFTYPVKAIDPEGDDLTYSLTVVPATTSVMAINSDNGEILWNPAFADVGFSFDVTVKVTDVGGVIRY
ncbi:hypothetical protein ES708_28705 [subsurface metagenome]